MSYLEPLPASCPPEGAEEITAPRQVFRLVRTNPPSIDDFKSQQAENPDRIFSGVTECQARGLSVFADRQDAVGKALKLPSLRGRLVCRVALGAGAGRIQQTGQPSHHTWWPLAAFDITSNCEVDVE